MLQVVVEIEQGFLWSYKGFYVSYKVFMENRNLAVTNQIPQFVPSMIVSAHRQILGMAWVVCVLVKICVSSISLYKLDPDKLTTPFESAHQFTLVCTVSDFKTVPGCTTIHAQNHSFVLTD